MKEYSYSVKNEFSPTLIAGKLNDLLGGEIPVVICIGTDAAIGDSVGPVCGTMLKSYKKNVFVYGSLSSTVTAKEIKQIIKFVKSVHPLEKILVIDAAVGKEEDVGTIKISDGPIKPGLGAEKDLPALGDVSVIAIVGARTKSTFDFLSNTRLSFVYLLSKLIADGIKIYLDGENNESKAALPV